MKTDDRNLAEETPTPAPIRVVPPGPGPTEAGDALERCFDCVQIFSAGGCLLWSNDASRRTFGPGATADGAPWLQCWKPADRAGAIVAIAGARVRKGTRFSAWNLAAPGKESFWDVSLSFLPSAPGGEDRFLAVARNLTAAHQAEERLRERAAQLQLVIENEPDCVKLIDGEGRLLEMNPAGLAMLEADSLGEAQQRSLSDIVAPRHRTAFLELHQRVLAGEKGRLQFEITGLRGAKRWLEIRAVPLRDDGGRVRSLLGLTRDISDQRRLEEQALHAQRLEGIGLLATGIAHDLNNVLTPILMAVPLLSDHVTEPGGRQLLQMMKGSVERGAALVRQILEFAHRGDGNFTALHVARLIHEFATVIGETFPKSIRFECSISPGLWAVNGDSVQLQQVLLNLCVNARDAMPAGGSLRLAAANRTLSGAEAGAIPGGCSGDFVMLEVEDTGSGIPAEILTHIWEPFYTTKGLKAGTGLGLPTVRGIVERHGGFVSLATAPGRGSTFRIWLPAVKDKAPPTAAFATAEMVRGNGELILVVDDEPAIGELASAVLTSRGFRVLITADGQEAATLLADKRHAISIVITDIHMPKLGGWALVDVATRCQPDAKIIVMSGSSGEIPPDQTRRERGVVFMPKPLTIAGLLSHVQRALNQPPATPPLA